MLASLQILLSSIRLEISAIFFHLKSGTRYLNIDLECHYTVAFLLEQNCSDKYQSGTKTRYREEEKRTKEKMGRLIIKYID